MPLFLEHFIFLIQWWFWRFFSKVAYFERWVLTLGYFSDVFLLSSKLYKSGLHMIPHFEQEQYSIRGFLELVSVKCSCLTTMQMTQFWSANYICLVHELKFLFQTCRKFWVIFTYSSVFGSVFVGTFWRLWKLVLLG